MTIRQAIDKISKLGHESAAKWAVASALELDQTDFILSLDDEISLVEVEKIEDIIDRLKKNEPIQYILGSWQFIDIELKTDKRALIPRPETELLAVQALEYAKSIDKPVIYDVGCGTGCIGLYLKYKSPEAQVNLVDISDDALSLARENAKALELDCEFVKADMLTLSKLPCDIIVSNPPYIKTDVVLSLDANVKKYEPHLALDGGTDGLDYYRALSELADNSLNDNGAILMEIGIDQGDEVKEIFDKHFDNIKVVKDYNEIDRIIIAKRGKHV